MSEHEEERPLTRREIRLREMATAEKEPEPVVQEDAQATNSEEAQDSAQPPLDDEIEISPNNEDGTPRTRREIRELRQQALAERASAQQTHAAAAPVAQTPSEVRTEPEDDVEVQAADEPEVPEAVMEPESPPDTTEGETTEATESETETGTEGEASAESDDVATDTGIELGELAADTEILTQPAASEFDVPTQPFSVRDLEEAEQRAQESADNSVDADTDTDTEKDAELESDGENPTDEEESITPPKSALRFPWRRGARAKEATTPELTEELTTGEMASRQMEPGETDSEALEEGAVDEDPLSAAVSNVGSTDAAELTDVAEQAESTQAAELDESADAAEPTADAADASESEDTLPEELEATDDRPLDVVEEAEAVDEIVADDVEAPESDAAEDTSSEVEDAGDGYSFPNIEPPEEWRSVFDDPATRVVPTTPPTENTGTGEGFDDLISRAVVQEGSTGRTGGSALILPEMPDDAGLTGTLGGTGELFVTGSIEVPKSIGETGGHSSLHDSIEVDPMEDLSESAAGIDERDSGPVSARRAISAMAQTGVPSASEVKQDRSRLPLVLSVTGGGLVVVVGGLIIWGAVNGFFG